MAVIFAQRDRKLESPGEWTRARGVAVPPTTENAACVYGPAVRVLAGPRERHDRRGVETNCDRRIVAVTR